MAAGRRTGGGFVVDDSGALPARTAQLAGLAATARFAVRLATALDTVARPAGETLWLGLFGEVGAGKTTLTARLVPALRERGWPSDGTEEVASPTYAIEHLYLRGTLLHADLYRLSEARLPQLSLLDTTARAALVEWPERIEAVAAMLDLELHLGVTSASGRSVRLVARTERGIALLQALDG